MQVKAPERAAAILELAAENPLTGWVKPSKQLSSSKANIHAGFDGFDGFDWAHIVEPEEPIVDSPRGASDILGAHPIIFFHNILSRQSRQSRQKPCAAMLSGLTAFPKIDGLAVRTPPSGTRAVRDRFDADYSAVVPLTPVTP